MRTDAAASLPAARTSPVSNAYCTTRWVVRGVSTELATNIARRGGKRWRKLLRKGGRLTPPPAGGALAVVTGATGGLGAEICTGLASLGYEVVVAGRDPRRGEALASRLRSSGARSRYVRWDAADLTSAHAVARAAGSRPCALLVNNAGVMGRGASKAETMRTNLLAPAALTLALLPALRRHASPRVVNVGSSSHLRVCRVAPATLERYEPDADLLAYAQVGRRLPYPHPPPRTLGPCTPPRTRSSAGLPSLSNPTQ